VSYKVDASESRRRTAEAVQQIRSEIERSSAGRSQSNAVDFEHTLTELRRLSTINAHWGIVSSWPVFGRLEVLAKRTMRILLRWYINPLVEQQNTFNLAVLASLYEIEAQIHELYSKQRLDDNWLPKDDTL
jgi:hypothetical protein